ncbi:MAG: DUF2339 domain-containing protein [Gallionella sp.]|nr:DUF2339 domain-containing protein [Gallionella sp.]MDD4946111.1 DUF2339 domain-containing protein [Gallionella sp.]MDD5612143.1 DUF2339 domain-containing protein [Gallionella sp.]
MPPLLYAIIGLILGGNLGVPAAIFGAAAGYALGVRLNNRSDRISKLEENLTRLRREVDNLTESLDRLRGVNPQATAAFPASEADQIPLQPKSTPAVAQPEPKPIETASPQTEPPFVLPPRRSVEVIEIVPPTLSFQPILAFKDWLLGGNTLVRAGSVVLFFGLAFLVKFAAEHTQVPIEFRYLGICALALGLLSLGWRLREKRTGYAMALQGLAVAILYLAIFAAYRLHGLIPGGLTFVLLVAVCALSAMLAILQNAPAMAVIGISGGFLAPVLASTGSGSHIALFSYYALLNAGILAIAWFKAWRPLNVLGFLFTFGIGSFWGWHEYRDELFASCEAFLVLFFFLYLAISLLYARKRKELLSEFAAMTVAGERVDYVDATLVFGTPLAAFGLQYLMVQDMAYGAAFSALGMGAIYLPLAAYLYRQGKEEARLLVESFLALGMVFGSLAIPLGLDARWTSAAWAAEGAGIFWVGLHQKRPVACWFGLLLQLGAGLTLGSSLTLHRSASFDEYWLASLFISVGGFVSGHFLHKAVKPTLPAMLANALLAWCLIWWWYGGSEEIQQHVPFYTLSASILFTTASAVLLLAARRYLDWPAAGIASAMILPLLFIFAAEAVISLDHPAERYGWAAWPLALAILWQVLRKQEGGWLAAKLEAGHMLALWLLASLTTWQSWWAFKELGQPGSSWPILGWALSPMVFLLALSRPELKRFWPFSSHSRAYSVGAIPIALGLLGWVFLANAISNGNMSPLPYVPLVNPLDLASAGALIVLLAWQRGMAPDADLAPQQLKLLTAVSLGSAGFVWLNGVLLRSLHHWADVPFDFGIMMQSTLVQAALSLFWALLAMGFMLLATRRGWRPLWLTGGALMALVVAKLFLVDLSRVGTVERIVSFLGVGILLLMLGYFSPVPPRKEE